MAEIVTITEITNFESQVIYSVSKEALESSILLGRTLSPTVSLCYPKDLYT